MSTHNPVQMFTAALFRIAKNGNKCLSADELVIYSHMEYYLAITANEGLIHSATRMNLNEASYKGSHIDDST